ncbi:hypothetical protein BU26DRAFT_310520 [Trematosphaeria pertusa]|uniref:Ubiquitin 3 binding protein But2 C-terminal domain-containing protein n=1 Tax=Trematosphaeria pertusa TaxID=390896 RepID=A0A6A6IF13_9PLEO|nr:uncharacterized protein BU26DRAFT_310520 [Trematosphaeria pertusa]KAF2249021.1 hypothetical protein BU26DRAFT_310520 [Trematosphaeria pertusa]
MKTFALFAALAATLLAAPNPPRPAECPRNAVQPNGMLPQGYIRPHLMLPISAKRPGRVFRPVDWDMGKVTPKDFCSIIQYELDPADTQGKICNLVFDFPRRMEAQGLYEFSGSGKFNFTGYAIGTRAVYGVTTYNNQPPLGPNPPNPPAVMEPGNSYIIKSEPCGIPAGVRGPVTFAFSLCSEDTLFVFEERHSICPLGFYIILTDDPNA